MGGIRSESPGRIEEEGFRLSCSLGVDVSLLMWKLFGSNPRGDVCIDAIGGTGLSAIQFEELSGDPLKEFDVSRGDGND